MHWLVLLLAAVFEAVWATALGESHGLTILAPSLIFAVASVTSVVGLWWAMRAIPVGTAYAVWTGIGAVLTVTYAIVSGNEAASPLKLLFLTGIIGCVIALKLTEGRNQSATESQPIDVN